MLQLTKVLLLLSLLILVQPIPSPEMKIIIHLHKDEMAGAESEPDYHYSIGGLSGWLANKCATCRKQWAGQDRCAPVCMADFLVLAGWQILDSWWNRKPLWGLRD